MKYSGFLGLPLAICTAFAPYVVVAADVSSWCPDGQRAYSAGNFEDANLALSSCLYNPPEEDDAAAEGYYLRGQTYADRLDYEAALSDFNRAVELNPDYADAWRAKAWVHYKQNDLHPAVTSIEQSLEADPHNTKSHHIHAQILTAMDRNSQAMDAYDLAYSFESPTTIQKLQRTLNSLGYEVGAADGVYGARTREALKACIADDCSIVW